MITVTILLFFYLPYSSSVLHVALFHLIYLLPHLFTYLFVYLLTYSLIYLFIYSFIHVFIYLFIYLLTYYIFFGKYYFLVCYLLFFSYSFFSVNLSLFVCTSLSHPKQTSILCIPEKPEVDFRPCLPLHFPFRHLTANCSCDVRTFFFVYNKIIKGTVSLILDI